MWPFDLFKKKKAERTFQGGQYNRLVSSWVSSNLSQDAEIRQSIKALRNRSRQLARDNDYVKAFLRSVQNNVVGRGIPFQARVKNFDGSFNQSMNNEIERAWKKWSKKDSCHVAGMLSFNDLERLSVRSMAESGEVFYRLIFKKFGKSEVPLALQVMESDMLDENFNGEYSGNIVRMGVESDSWGRPVAYHFFSRHPGDLSFPAKNQDQERIRVPASEIIHLFIPDRVIQSRGIPWTASALFKLHQLKGYEDASVVKKRVQAALMGFIQSPEGELQGDAVEDKQRVEDFEPGKFAYLGPGETVQVPNMGGGSEAEFDPFVRSMIRSIAAGIGSSYEEISRDYSQSNYSSSRLALISERDNWRSIQDFVISNFNQVVFEKWLDMAVMAGALKIPGYYSSPEKFNQPKWMPRGWEWVDPLKDVTADKEALASGLRSHSDILAEDGKDFEETMLSIKREREFVKSLGIELDFLIDKTAKDNAGGNDDESQKDSAPNAAN